MVYPFDLQENSILPTILIVDDQPENIKVFAELLSRKGYVCETMTDGMSALDQVESMMPDLILLDILMPGLSGFEVCLHLKNMPAVAAIPVIFVSAKEDLDSRLQAFEVGGVDYISKPIQPIELIARVNAHVQLYRLKRQSDAFNEQLNEQIAERTQQLNRLNERMATILASVTDAILLLTSDGKISNTNRGFDTMFSYSPDELFDFPLSHLVLESYLDALDTALDHINSGGSHVQVYAEAVRKDQTVFDVELTFSRIPQDPDHIVCTCHDISHLKETERIKDNFISMVTHELRTPITTLTLISSTLMTHYDRMTEDQRRVRMGHLQTQAGVLRELVESVLDISRLNARNMEFGNTVVDITDAASHVMNELAQTALEKDVALHAELPDTSVMVCGETVDISRIWRNLISNAIKYTDAGGEIVVRLGEMQVSQDHEWRSNLTLPASIPALQAGHYCVGQVADTGHGMDARDIDGLFVRFFRGWAKQSPIPGTGLGLSLVKELLEAYHGNICVESEPGIGSTFTFWLPIYSDQTKEGIR